MTNEPTASPQGLLRALRLRDVVLLNIVAIVGLRWLSTAAQMGPASLALWGLALLVFFVPSGLAVMELSTRHPGEGGVYLWTKRAFGDAHGFMAGWSYWVSNLVYFPSLLIFVAGVFLYLGGDAWLGLGESRLYNAAFALTVLWMALGLNIVGLSRGKWLQNVGAIGSWVTAALLIGFGLYAWVRFGSSVELSARTLLPDLTDRTTLGFFATMTFGFAGLELAPIMGGEIHKPERTIPQALLISGVVIATVYVAGTAVLLVALDKQAIDVISGVPQALAALGERTGVPQLARFGAALLVAGGIGGVGAWVAGTARLPFVAGVDRYLPPALSRVHPRWGTPHVALFVQGVLCSVLMLMSAAGATVSEAYNLLVDMTIVLYFIPFLYLFAALPLLKGTRADDAVRVLEVPGGRFGAWLVALAGLGATLLSLVFALLPPPESARPQLYVLKLVGGCGALLVVGVILYLRGRRAGSAAA